MTELHWLQTTDPKPLLQLLRGKTTGRKLRLFACACCRHIWHLLADERSRRAVEVAELYADGLVTLSDLLVALRECGDVPASDAARTAFWAADAASNADEAAWLAVEWSIGAAVQERIARESERCAALGIPADNLRSVEVREGAKAIEASKLAVLLRDVVGNPFRRRSPLAPSVLHWNNGLIRRLAEQAYDQRQLPSGQLDNARLAVLADALEEAGADAALVAHLREPRSHYRGCHVVDLILGRS